MNVKSQSELDIGGRETCNNNIKFIKLRQTRILSIFLFSGQEVVVLEI